MRHTSRARLSRSSGKCDRRSSPWTSGVLDLEYTALKMFAEVAKKQTEQGIQLGLIGMTPGILTLVQRSPLGQILRREAMHFNLEIAVRRYLSDEVVPERSWALARPSIQKQVAHGVRSRTVARAHAFCGHAEPVSQLSILGASTRPVCWN